MQLFKNKPSDKDLELIVFRAASMAKCSEIDSGKPCEPTDVIRWVHFAVDEKSLKADVDTLKFVTACVMALLTEEEFLSEVVQYQFNNPAKPIPIEYRGRMLSIIDDFVAAYKSQNRS